MRRLTIAKSLDYNRVCVAIIAAIQDKGPVHITFRTMSHYKLPKVDTQIQQKEDKDYQSQNPSSQDLEPFSLVPSPKRGTMNSAVLGQQ